MAATAISGSKSGLQEKRLRDKQLQDILDAEDSTDSLDQDRPSSPVRMTREEVLSVLGYRSERVPKPPTNVWSSQKSDLCHRCGKKVYQLERLDIGELYHRGCLKCYTCGAQLSLKTFHRVVTDDGKEVYCKTHIPKLEKSASKDSIGIRSAVEAQKKASEKVFKPYEQSAFKYDPEALEFQHARQIKQRQKVKRRASLKTNADFEKFGVFEAQEDLEKRHRQEEDELYRQIFEERQRLMRNLEELLSKEKEHTVKELVSWFEKQGSSKQEKENGIKEVEQFYLQQREDRIKKLMEGMAIEERAAVDRLIDKHAQEMLFLIEEKEKEAEQSLASPSRDKIGRDAYKFLSFSPSSKTKKDEGIAEEEEEEEEEENVENDEEEEEDEEGSEEEIGEEEKMEEEERYDEGRDNEEEEAMGKAQKNLNEDEEEEEEEEEEEMNEDKEEHKFSRGQTKEVINEEEDEEEIEDEPKHQKSNSSGDKEQAQDELETEEAFGTPESTDTDKSNKTNVAVVFEKPQEIEIQKLKTFPKKQKPAMESKTTQHAAQIMTDEETQTHAPVPKHRSPGQRSSGQRPPDSGHTRGTRDGLEQQLAASSPQAKKKKGSLPGSQFQIIISTEKIADGEYAGNRRGETQASRLKEAAHSSRASPRGKKNIAKDEDTDEEEDEPIRISAQPEAQPPACRKSKLYRNADIFKEFDQRAVEEAKKDPVSFTDLVRRLSQKCHTDLQKVRAIFRWITAKDLNKMKFTETEKSDSPMGLLKGIKYGTESYHNLFKRLCSYAGLHCKVIDGFSKGAGYRPGSKFKGDRFRNQWTAVWVDDSWRFINCHWGARHVKRVGDDQMTYKIDEFYFLTDPEEHIYQHFPDDPRWQLLKKPISIEDFVQMPVVKSPFFNNRLEFIMKTYSVLKATDGRVEVRLRIPELMSFAVKLKSKDKTVRDDSLKECSVIRMVNDHVVFLADLPSAGQFYWEIFVNSAWSSESMDNACSFLLYTSKAPPAHRTYPQGGCFGRTPICEQLEISEGTDCDPLIVSTGQLAVAVKVPKKTLRLSHNLRYWSPREKSLVDFDRFTFLQSRLDSNATFTIHCPNKGIYVLSLLVVDPGATKSKPVVFYRYLIDCQTAVANAHPLPHSSSKWFGCRLLEPVRGELQSNAMVQFQVESKLATEVVASVGGAWIALQRNSQNVWKAAVPTGEKLGKLCLYGRFESSKEKYIPLWEFIVKEATAVDEVRTLFKYL